MLIVHGNSAYFFGEKSIPPSAAGFPSTPIHDCRTYYLNSGVTRSGLKPGSIYIRTDRSGSVYCGNLNKNGTVSGLSKMYRELQIKPGVDIECKTISDSEIVLEIEPEGENIYNPLNQNNLSWYHFEPFRVNNFEHWAPNGENDILVAFGALMNFTDYEYCCYSAKDHLHKIGYFDYERLNNPNKPDAFLFDKKTRQYVMAEFKIKSSLFKSNHKPGDVAVLFVWEDDEKNRSHLPATVISLKDLAKSALKNSLN